MMAPADEINENIFPETKHLQSFNWSFVTFRPRHYSVEQFIIGVIAWNKFEFYFSKANQLDRLLCFYQGASDGIVHGINISLNAIENNLREIGAEFLNSPSLPVLGVGFGEPASAQGMSARHVAERWHTTSSSLYNPDVIEEVIVNDNSTANSRTQIYRKPIDELQLGQEIMKYVVAQRPDYRKNFNPIISPQSRKSKRRPFESEIDYTGSKIVASFATFLKPTFPSGRRVKQRLWDLSISKNKETLFTGNRKHIMLVQVQPTLHHRSLSAAVTSNEELIEIAEDAKKLGIEIMPFVAEIDAGQTILMSEAGKPINSTII